MKAIILTAEKFEDMELFFPMFRLIEEGVEITVAGPKKGRINGENGYTVDIAKAFEDVNPDDYDILLLPGGDPSGAPLTVSKSKKAQEIAKSFFQKNKPVGVICHGPYTLINADVLKGRTLTSYWHDGVPEGIKKAGGIWVDKEVVVDGNLVSSRSPVDLPEFMRELVKLIKK